MMAHFKGELSSAAGFALPSSDSTRIESVALVGVTEHTRRSISIELPVAGSDKRISRTSRSLFSAAILANLCESIPTDFTFGLFRSILTTSALHLIITKGRVDSRETMSRLPTVGLVLLSLSRTLIVRGVLQWSPFVSAHGVP